MRDNDTKLLQEALADVFKAAANDGNFGKFAGPGEGQEKCKPGYFWCSEDKECKKEVKESRDELEAHVVDAIRRHQPGATSLEDLKDKVFMDLYTDDDIHDRELDEIINRTLGESYVKEGMGQPDDFTGAEPDYLPDEDEVNDGSQRNDFWRMKVSKAVEDVDNEDFLRKVIETIWVMREKEGITGPGEIGHDFSDDELHDEPMRGETDQEMYGYPGDR